MQLCKISFLRAVLDIWTNISELKVESRVQFIRELKLLDVNILTKPKRSGGEEDRLCETRKLYSQDTLGKIVLLSYFSIFIILNNKLKFLIHLVFDV